MKLSIVSKRSSLEGVRKRFPDARILDVTSAGPQPWVKFSPFYPIGGVPVPFSEGSVSYTVEGIWQGLKVFAHADIDVSKFAIQSMKGLKRSARQLGRVLGHRRGVFGTELLDYRSARSEIYLPSYRFVLEQLGEELEQMAELASGRQLVLLDYNTNRDLDDVSKPLSHASLIAARLVELFGSIESTACGTL